MNTNGPPQFVPVDETPEAVAKAALEMIAQALREGSDVYNVTLSDVTYDGARIGDWEISVRKIAE